MTALRAIGIGNLEGRSTAARQRDASAAVRLYAAISEAEHFGSLCGGCHQNGAPPSMLLSQCEVCERTRSEIVRAHGLCELSGDRQGDRMLLAGILREVNPNEGRSS